jgi:hypothetical protein
LEEVGSDGTNKHWFFFNYIDFSSSFWVTSLNDDTIVTVVVIVGNI